MLLLLAYILWWPPIINREPTRDALHSPSTFYIWVPSLLAWRRKRGARRGCTCWGWWGYLDSFFLFVRVSSIKVRRTFTCSFHTTVVYMVHSILYMWTSSLGLAASHKKQLVFVFIRLHNNLRLPTYKTSKIYSHLIVTWKTFKGGAFTNLELTGISNGLKCCLVGRCSKQDYLRTPPKQLHRKRPHMPTVCDHIWICISLG